MTEINVAASNFRAFSRNTLRGFVDLTLTDIGLTIRGAAWHGKSDKQWLNLPSKAMFDKEGNAMMDANTGKQRFQPIVEVSNSVRDEFQSAALAAIHRLTDQDRKPPEMPQEDEAPF